MGVVFIRDRFVAMLATSFIKLACIILWKKTRVIASLRYDNEFGDIILLITIQKPFGSGRKLYIVTNNIVSANDMTWWFVWCIRVMFTFSLLYYRQLAGDMRKSHILKQTYLRAAWILTDI